uniref:Uncharacterized protein n=1 Tax=viral metagenome TaxID=1070528 RepID=A0A6H1ZIP6_9ZZZZ
MEKAVYLTDDRDYPVEDQRTLVIFSGGNGDWYVQVAPAHGRTTEGVRICTSGGAASQCPGLGIAIADAYRAIRAAGNDDPPPRSRFELEAEVDAWRRRFPGLMFDGFELVNVVD